MQYFEQSKIIEALSIPLRLFYRYSVVFPAINLAFVMGAKEVYLIGVEMDDNLHWDGAGNYKNFPHADGIFSIFERQRREYAESGMDIYTCRHRGKLAKTIKTAEYEQVVSQSMPLFVTRLRDRIKKCGKVFLLGAAPSLNDVPLQNLCGWPVIGVNTAFQKYPLLDAIMFGDPGIVKNYSDILKAWQDFRAEPPIFFWFDEYAREGFRKVFS